MRKRTLIGIVLLLSGLFAGTAGAYDRSPVDLSHLRNADYSAYFAAHPRLAPYPVSYDLRDVDGVSWVTPVRNQSPYGTCWAHAALASMESVYLRRTGAALDLSEMYLAYYTYMDPAGFTASDRPLVFPDILDKGGNYNKAVAALARGNGAILEADLPYDGGEPSGAASDYPKGLRLRHAYFLSVSDPDNPSDYPLAPQLTDDIRKELIVTHGAIAVIFDAGDHNVNDATSAWYNNINLTPEDDPDPRDRYHPDHGVAIVGWDDTYPRERFNEAMRPARDGAWLVKNSWGEEHGHGGYYWISYEDESLEAGVVFIPEDASADGSLYDYDTLGWCDSIDAIGNDVGEGVSTTGWMANVFTARGAEELRAVSFYTTDNNAAYEISVHTSPESGNPAGGTRASFQSGSQPIAGYHTVDLETPVSLAPGTAFSVVVKVTNPFYSRPIAVESWQTDYTENAEANPGESFVSPDGAAWVDAGDDEDESRRANVCVKAFTVDAPSPAPSSGGGCDAGAGVLALVCLLPASRKVRKIFTL